MMIGLMLVACDVDPTNDVIIGSSVTVTTTSVATDCHAAKNVCTDYAPSWVAVCPTGSRCLVFDNASDTQIVSLTYSIGCNGDGTKGAPQCDCTQGPILAPGGSTAFVVTDGAYTSCLPSWQPACLTAGLAVVANVAVPAAPDSIGASAPTCQGTRFEFSAGNTADPYGKFDSYDVDLEKGYSVPVTVAPVLPNGCANDHAAHDCRPLSCAEAQCQDAYLTPTSGGCPGRSPQVGCQDTFSDPAGLAITWFPDCAAAGTCLSCQDAVACP